jgi:ATP adenylyltransferase/5',5'''-P-1,P-4-tetraphosphate phosphorylase II
MQKQFSEKRLFIDDDNINDLPLKAERLFEHQLSNWKLASDGYKSLATVQVKQFEFGNFSIEAHFNPGRIISSSAKVDAKSIQERPCFLCTYNLPEEQKAAAIFDDYILLVNPFPIFNKHFTIPSINHIPQAIESGIENLLKISLLLGKDYSVFYNGPKCGASAPDHVHFQAGNFGFMKIDFEYLPMLRGNGRPVYSGNEITTSIVTGCLRNFISIESANSTELIKEFKRILVILSSGSSAEEPMMNIICYYSNSWKLLIFPRRIHRPSYYFEEGDNRILISPAAVDMGGVLIFPREEDFNKITRELIIDIFRQVTFSDEEFALLSDKLMNRQC